MVKRYAMGPILLLLAGCAKPPSAWRLTGQVLTPPRVANPSVEHAIVRVPRATDCTPKRKLSVDRAELEKRDRGWLADWSERCGDPSLAARVLEAVPLTTGVGFRLMHADDVRAGFVDLGPGNRMEVLSPIVREGTDENAPLIEEQSVAGTDQRIEVVLKTSPNLVGQEAAFYGFEPKAGGGSRIVPISATARVRGIEMPLERAGKNYFTFTGQTGYYRMFFKPEEQTAVMVGAAARDQLPRDLAGCDKVECITLPKRVGINPYLEVSVNGKLLAIPAHMPPTVRAVLQAAKVRAQDVLPTLAITKPYAGKPAPVEFDRTKLDVLGLVLSGDEAIRW
jgi:hypothetical protein